MNIIISQCVNTEIDSYVFAFRLKVSVNQKYISHEKLFPNLFEALNCKYERTKIWHFNFKIPTMIRKPHFKECYSDLLLENAMGIPHFSSGEPRGDGNGIFQYKSSMRKTTEPMFASPLHPSCTPNSYQMFGLSSYFTATAISCKNVQLALLTLNGD